METNKELLSKTITELTKKLQKRYNIGQTQVYKRQKYLNIVSHKNKQEGAWLTSEELQQLDFLHEHLKTGQPMENYQRTNFLVATPESLNQEPELVLENTLVHQASEPENIEQTASAEEIFPHTIQSEEFMGNSEAVAAIKRAAQTKAAGNIILTNLLAEKYQNNPKLIDPDLLEAIAKSEQVAVPKSLDPISYAQEMLRRLSLG